MERTGNGRRESFRYLPIPRMTNTFIENGKDRPADILASTKNGLYVQSLSGGSVDPTSGRLQLHLPRGLPDRERPRRRRR